MNSHTISIVTVTWNNLPGLVETCESVWEQTYPQLEHIVVDGQSSDGSDSFLRERGAGRCAWISEPDSGIYDAMNKGWRMATGELVLFLNAGDRLANRWVVEQVLADYADHAWPWAVGISRMVHGDTTVTLKHMIPLRRAQFLSGITSLPHQATFVRRQSLLDVGGFDESESIAADQLLNAQLMATSLPHELPLVISDCDAAGVSTRQSSDAFVWQMKRFRARVRLSFTGSMLLDSSLSLPISLALRLKRDLRRPVRSLVRILHGTPSRA